MSEHRDVFHPVDDEADDPELLGTADGEYTYLTEENVQVALEKFNEYEAKKYVKYFDTYAELQEFLEGGVSVISQVHV